MYEEKIEKFTDIRKESCKKRIMKLGINNKYEKERRTASINLI